MFSKSKSGVLMPSRRLLLAAPALLLLVSRAEAQTQTSMMGCCAMGPAAATGGGGGGSFTTFDPVNRDPAFVLSGGNLIGSTAGGGSGAPTCGRSLAAMGSAKYRFEITINTAVEGIGICNASFGLNGNSGLSTNSVSIYTGDGNFYLNGTNVGASGVGVCGVGDVIGIEVDPVAKTIQAVKNGGSVGSPASFAALTGPFYAVMCLKDNASASQGTANFGPSWATAATAGYGPI